MDNRGRIERLARLTGLCLQRGRRGRATILLRWLSEAAQPDGWYASPAELSECLFRIAGLAMDLAKTHAAGKDVAGAVAACRLALAGLRRLDPAVAGQRMIECAEFLCALFRYRLTVEQMVAGFRKVISRTEDVSQRQVDSMTRKLEGQLPQNREAVISYWHYWGPEGVEAFDLAASVYDQFGDRQDCREKAFTIREDLAGRLKEAEDPDVLAKSESVAQEAIEAGFALIVADYAEFAPRVQSLILLACSVNWKLERWERILADGERALRLISEMSPRGAAVPLENKVLLAKIISLAHQKTGNRVQAVAVLEEVLAECRKAVEDRRPDAEPLLADVLHNLGVARLRTGDGEKAVSALMESITQWRGLAAQNSDAYGAEAAGIAETLAGLCEQAGYAEHGATFRAEAAQWLGRKPRLT